MVLFSFFIFIFIIYIILKSNTTYIQSAYNLLAKVFYSQQFSNVATVYSNGSYHIIKADGRGENYIFGVKTTNAPFTSFDVEKLYELASRSHIHTVVLATNTTIQPTSPIYRKIRQYGIDVWDKEKLLSLSAYNNSTTSSTSNHSILKTSDTSDDTCEIDTNSFNPIQDGNLAEGFFSRLFDRPDRL